MIKKILLTTAMSLCAFAAQASANITGYWTTIDDETKEAKSVVQVYEYQGKYYGRVVELLQNPGAKAKIKGSPSIKGLTIIWDLEKEYTVDPADFVSMGKASPFTGWTVQGECVATVCGGKIVWKKSE